MVLRFRSNRRNDPSQSPDHSPARSGEQLGVDPVGPGSAASPDLPLLHPTSRSHLRDVLVLRVRRRPGHRPDRDPSDLWSDSERTSSFDRASMARVGCGWSPQPAVPLEVKSVGGAVVSGQGNTGGIRAAFSSQDSSACSPSSPAGHNVHQSSHRGREMPCLQNVLRMRP